MPRPGRTLHVFPDAARRQAALRAERRARGIAVGTHLLTWDDFVHTLGGAGELNRRPCPATAARAVVAGLGTSLGSTPFGDYVREPAFARAAAEVLLDLKAGRLSARELQDAAEVLPPERRTRVRVLARLYHLYEQRLAELGLADREDVLRGAREALDRGAWPAGWDGVTGLVLHGVYDVRPSKLELLLGLAAACESRRVLLRVETPVGGSPVADAALAALFRAFENRGETMPHVDLFKADVTFEGRPFTDLGRHLFSPRAARDVLKDAVQGLSVWNATSAREEARVVARDVRRLMASGSAPGDIAIAYRDLGPEAGWLAEALGELGVPVRLPWGEPLALAGPVRLALELPVLIEDGFPAERVAEIVASRYVPSLSRGGPDAPAALFALAAARDDRLGATRGKGAYDVRLEGLARRLQAQGGRHKEDAVRVMAVRALRDRVMRLIDECRHIPQEGSAAELVAAWWKVVERLGLLDSAGPRERREEGTLGARIEDARARDDAALAAFRQRMEDLLRSLRAVGGGPRITRRTLGRWLADTLKDTHLPARGPTAGAVEVLDLREVPGRTFRHLFVAGLTEGRLPGRDPPSPLLGDAERVALNQHLTRDVFRLTGGEFDERAPWRLTEDRLLFASALAAAEATLSLSFAVQAAGGQEQVPSAFLEEVRRLTGRHWATRALSPVLPLDEVLTRAELRRTVALEALAYPKLRVTEPDPAGPLLKEHFATDDWFRTARELAHMEAARLRFFGSEEEVPGEFTGGVQGAELEQKLRETFHFGLERPLSASALARFGNCGFQGFVAYGLKVAEPVVPGEEFDARGRGTFWHRVMEEVFQALKDQKLLGQAPEDIPKEVLEKAVKKASKHFEELHHVGHRELWKLAGEKAHAMVRRILTDQRRGLPFDPLVPEGFELKFGPAAKDKRWSDVKLMVADDAIIFEGQIDRLDTAGVEVGVIDYKTGKLDKRTLKENLLRSDFQLPLYLYAARESGHVGARNAAWFSLRTGATIHLSDVLPPAELEDLLSTDPEVRQRVADAQGLNLPNAVETLVKRLRKGDFPARPNDCGRCGYRAVCRITERRVTEEGSG
ncbi:PD-(D/E)XK nuclease family protein [Corallococcus llansteffanensis]|uniref:PD-(D/E)XK nuclease family protein n=1 Tax=Corallococcus llansteffanensis TaxID=2316731 RepID=A0A3A8PBX2_9BACT|nr:PD-(D/E)XK nuclease family protein [Corallococcus llansteffanensis]RKH52071.1 PD-(D/E)XK nuclease family protein [Corallococcus llansteffanensis]